MRRVLYALTWAGMVLAVGCGGPGEPGVLQARQGEEPARAVPGNQAGAAVEAARTGSEAASPEGPPGPSGAECQALLDHFLALAQAAHAANMAPELVPTPEQVAGIRAQLAPRYIPACQSMDRATYECERAATSIEQQLACSPETGARPGVP